MAQQLQHITFSNAIAANIVAGTIIITTTTIR
jgi:hypothetical protein